MLDFTLVVAPQSDGQNAGHVSCALSDKAEKRRCNEQPCETSKT